MTFNYRYTFLYTWHGGIASSTVTFLQTMNVNIHRSKHEILRHSDLSGSDGKEEHDGKVDNNAGE